MTASPPGRPFPSSSRFRFPSSSSRFRFPSSSRFRFPSVARFVSRRSPVPLPVDRPFRFPSSSRLAAVVSGRAMALNPTASNDHMVNKVAVCSAVFAGFAYVGYSVAKNVFGRRPGRKSDDGESRRPRVQPTSPLPCVRPLFTGCRHENQRLYFRRLSQTTQTDVLLGNLDHSDGDHAFLRPMTVQQRIKQLNLRARMFADTMMAIQTPSNKHTLHGPRSLQVSISRTLNCTPLRPIANKTDSFFLFPATDTRPFFFSSQQTRRFSTPLTTLLTESPPTAHATNSEYRIYQFHRSTDKTCIVSYIYIFNADRCRATHIASVQPMISKTMIHFF